MTTTAITDIKQNTAVKEMIGRSGYDGRNAPWRYRAIYTTDRTITDYAFWDRLRRGEAWGYRLGGLFAQPIAEIIASWSLGGGTSAKLADNVKASPEQIDYTNGLLARFSDRIQGMLLTAVIDLYCLGDMYIMVNPDGSLSVPSPDTVEVVYDARDFHRPIEVKITTRTQGAQIIDVWTDRTRTLTVTYYGGGSRARENPVGTVERVYDNLLGRIPIVHFANDRGTNEINGRPIFEALLYLFERYDDLITKSLDGAELMGNPIPAFVGMKDVNATKAALLTTPNESITDDYDVNRSDQRINWDILPAVFLGEGGDFKFVSPGTGYTADIREMLRALELEMIYKARIPEVVWGKELSSANHTAVEQMKTFYMYIEGRRLMLEGDSADDELDFEPQGGLLAVYDLWLRTQRLIHGRKVLVAPCVMRWPELSSIDQALQFQWTQWLYANNLVTDVEVLSQSQLVENPAVEAEKARAEVYSTLRIDRAEKLLRNTMVDYYTAQQMMGVEKPNVSLSNLFFVDGVGPVPSSELGNIMKYKLTIAPSVYNSELLTGEPLPQPVDPSQVIPTDNGAEQLDATVNPDGTPIDTPVTETEGQKPLYVALSLPNNPDLIGLQPRLKALYNDPNAVWESPADYNIPLLEAMADEAQAQAFASGLSSIQVPDLSLSVGSLYSFDDMGRHELRFRIPRNQALLDLQGQIYALAQQAGIVTQSASIPSNYTPCIPVGYLPNKQKKQTYDARFTVKPDGLYATYDDAPLYGGEEPPADDGTVAEIRRASVIMEIVRRVDGSTTTTLPKHTADYIAGISELVTDKPTIIAAALRHHQRVTIAEAIQSTRLDFEGAVEALLLEAVRGGVKRSTFVSRLMQLIRGYGEQAYRDGLKDGGVESELDDSDLAQFRRFADEQRQYVQGIADAIYADDRVTPDEAENKPAMWFNKSVYPQYLMGIESASQNAALEWVLGSTDEHCGSCRALSGQVRRAKYWLTTIQPKSGALACKGFNCECTLQPTDRPISKGSLPRWGVLESTHTHHHAHA